jgi:hypothetical protein
LLLVFTRWPRYFYSLSAPINISRSRRPRTDRRRHRRCAFATPPVRVRRAAAARSPRRRRAFAFAFWRGSRVGREAAATTGTAFDCWAVHGMFKYKSHTSELLVFQVGTVYWVLLQVLQMPGDDPPQFFQFFLAMQGWQSEHGTLFLTPVLYFSKFASHMLQADGGTSATGCLWACDVNYELNAAETGCNQKTCTANGEGSVSNSAFLDGTQGHYPSCKYQCNAWYIGIGTSSDGRGPLSCNICQAGTAAAAGAVSCTDCGPGYYSTAPH